MRRRLEFSTTCLTHASHLMQVSGHTANDKGIPSLIFNFSRSEMRVPTAEEFIELLAKSPRLEAVFLNGCKTYEIGRQIVGDPRTKHLQVVLQLLWQ